MTDPYDMPTPVVALGPRTLVHDRTSNRQVMWIAGVVVLPIGAQVELGEPNENVTVVGVRWLAGDPGVVCIDVEVPGSWWDAQLRHLEIGVLNAAYDDVEVAS
jgi:hypothetical protein